MLDLTNRAAGILTNRRAWSFLVLLLLAWLTPGAYAMDAPPASARVGIGGGLALSVSTKVWHTSSALLPPLILSQCTAAVDIC